MPTATCRRKRRKKLAVPACLPAHLNPSDDLPFMFILRGQTLVNPWALSNGLWPGEESGCGVGGADRLCVGSPLGLSVLPPLHWFTRWHQNWWGIKLATVQQRQIGWGEEKGEWGEVKRGEAGDGGLLPWGGQRSPPSLVDGEGPQRTC